MIKMKQMTCRELLAIEHPELVNNKYSAGCSGCPIDYNYADDPDYCRRRYDPTKCHSCWDREADEEVVKRVLNSSEFDDAVNVSGIPEDDLKESVEAVKKQFSKDELTILDSGDRTEFPSGAVRDMRVGKGRCDLLPLDVVAEYIKLRINNLDYPIILHINAFTENNDLDQLYAVLDYFVWRHYDGEYCTMLLEVAKHFEEGAKKYGDNNWQKGIPVNCYIDSAVRHYLKYLRGDRDEPHDRAFCWNILCCIWTVKHIEEAKENV